MADIRTPDDWWKTVDARWEEFETIAGMVASSRPGALDGPSQFEDSKMHVSAPTFWGRMTQARADRDHKTVWMGLELMWEGAPDRLGIHDWPGWGDLCDCCSEVWVFEPEESAAS